MEIIKNKYKLIRTEPFFSKIKLGKGLKLLKFIEIRSSGNSKTLNTKIIFVQKKNNFWSSQFNYDFEFNEWYKLYNSFTPVINNKSLNQCKLLLYVNAIDCTQK